jgi:hypothetical protein
MENGIRGGASLYRQSRHRVAETTFTTKTTNAMKKQVKKLSLTTDKVVSLNKASLANVQGGRPSNSGQSYNCIKPSNSGQSYNC